MKHRVGLREPSVNDFAGVLAVWLVDDDPRGRQLPGGMVDDPLWCVQDGGDGLHHGGNGLGLRLNHLVHYLSCFLSGKDDVIGVQPFVFQFEHLDALLQLDHFFNGRIVVVGLLLVEINFTALLLDPLLLLHNLLVLVITGDHQSLLFVFMLGDLLLKL